SHVSSQSHHPHPDLPSFPTRRSSDLGPSYQFETAMQEFHALLHTNQPEPMTFPRLSRIEPDALIGDAQLDGAVHSSQCHCGVPRSEEHTSELQSLTNLVCRLLLEKKN